MSRPGRAFAAAMSSFTFVAGTDGCTTSVLGASSSRETGAMSRSVSYGIFAKMLGLIASEAGVMPIVYPSGADFTTSDTPMRLLAPERLSTTTCFPIDFADPRRDDARDDVARPARRRRHDQPDRARGIVLRDGGQRRKRGRHHYRP